jgi:ribosomal protein S18 acetylase RimI-like enzyme
VTETVPALPRVPADLAWQALSGPLAPFVRRTERAAVMDADVGIFAALADQRDPRAWDDLAGLVGAGSDTVLFPLTTTPPSGWRDQLHIPGVQMVGHGVDGRRRADVVEVGAADVDEVLELVERTRPGPFARRTIELGGYLGLRRDGHLVAVAGRRLATDGLVEVSAVCVDPAHRREGLARVVVDAVVAGIRAEGRTPMLHAAADNTGAIALYEAMGFEVSDRFDFVDLRTPGDPAAPVGAT